MSAFLFFPTYKRVGVSMATERGKGRSPSLDRHPAEVAVVVLRLPICCSGLELFCMCGIQRAAYLVLGSHGRVRLVFLAQQPPMLLGKPLLEFREV